jgi:ABC-type transporter Mla MlaB component
MGVTNETPSVMKLDGTIDIRSIQNCFDTVRGMASDAAGLDVDLSAVTEVDLTFLQLIESLRRTAHEGGTALRLSHPVGEAIREVLRRAGFLSDPPDERTRFWLAGAGPAA